jgi:hypothetical protein
MLRKLHCLRHMIYHDSCLDCRSRNAKDGPCAHDGPRAIDRETRVETCLECKQVVPPKLPAPAKMFRSS